MKNNDTVSFVIKAENFEKYMGTNPIIAIKGAKVSDFGGKCMKET